MIGEAVTRTKNGRPKIAPMIQAKTVSTNRLAIPAASKAGRRRSQSLPPGRAFQIKFLRLFTA